MKRLIAVATLTLRAAGLIVGGLTVTECGTATGSDRINLTVLAASSLTEAFGELGTTYHRSHRNVTVTFAFGGSQDVAVQAGDRIPGDVVATADEQTINDVARYVSGRRVIAHSALTIAVAPGNPKKIRGLADLANPTLRVVLGGPTVPVGRYAHQVLAKAGVTVEPVSEEADARSVLARVRTGEADAALVYLTDAESAGAATSSVPVPVRQNVETTYVAAAIDHGSHDRPAKAFVAWLSSSEAKDILRKYGFRTP